MPDQYNKDTSDFNGSGDHSYLCIYWEILNIIDSIIQVYFLALTDKRLGEGESISSIWKVYFLNNLDGDDGESSIRSDLAFVLYRMIYTHSEI